MAENDDVTMRAAFEHWPARMSLFVIAPVFLAIGQLCNAFLVGFPLWAAAAFAAVMIGYAVMAARLHQTRLRVVTLERSARSDPPRASTVQS